jgi:hypothetical protein
LNRHSRTVAEIRRHAGALAVHVNEPLVNYLVVGRSLCRDLDTLLVLLVIIQRANRHPDFARLDPTELAEGRIGQIPTLAVNLQSIADSTGIPRETVRRKVNDLVRLGWVAREGAMLRFTPKGYCAVAPARDAAIRLTATIAYAVNRMLKPDGEPQAPSE